MNNDMAIKCRKRPYHADAIQWHGLNFREVSDMIERGGCIANLYGTDMVMIRSARGVDTLRLGDWVVRGENDQVKTYTDSVFHIKYEFA